MKIFLAQIYFLFIFGYYSKRYHTNENISDGNLLLAPFGYCSKRYRGNENISYVNLLLAPF